MKCKISNKLFDIYKKQHKNVDYAISSILDNFDPDSYVDCFNMVKEFVLDGEKCEINIGEDLIERIIADLELEILDEQTVELLLWMGAIFPEV